MRYYNGKPLIDAGLCGNDLPNLQYDERDGSCVGWNPCYLWQEQIKDFENAGFIEKQAEEIK